MPNIKQIILQEENEARYNRKHIDGYLRTAILDNPVMQAKIVQGTELVEAYMAKTYYESKNKRIAQLKGLDIPALILDIFVGVCYCQLPELFTSVTAKTAGRLRFSDKTAAITTVAELMAVLCNTDAFDIVKTDKMASLMVQSQIPLSNELLMFIENSSYLPPMVCVPLELTNNYTNGHLSHNDSLILGTGNHHDGDLCLDVLNTLNKVQLQLDTKFLSTVEEDPTKEFTVEWAHKKADEKGKTISDATAKIRVAAAIENWHRFKTQGYNFYSLMVNQGNVLHLTHKVDKRGRIYAQGYNISTQGNAFKKAMVELAHEELVTGVPCV